MRLGGGWEREVWYSGVAKSVMSALGSDRSVFESHFYLLLPIYDLP